MKKSFAFLLFAVLTLLTGCSNALLDPDNTEPTVTPENEYVSYDKINVDSIIIDETDTDYLCLKNAQFFAESGVGYAGELPEEIYAVNRLFKKENALDYFYKLESDANNEGKLYALCGLYYLDSNNYAYLMEKYGATEETVTYMQGCEWQEDYPIREIIVSEYGVDFNSGYIPEYVIEISS